MNLSAIHPDKDYRNLAAKLDELPTLPSIVYELGQLINDPMTSTTEIELVMEKDQSLTAKVLRLINSAYYAIPGGVTSLSRAIGYLGFDIVNQLVLSTTILKALEVKSPARFDFQKFWQHTVGVAIASETIAKQLNHKTPSDLFTAGLVHDIGKVATYFIDADAFINITRHAVDNRMSMSETEAMLQVPRHELIGQMLAKRWNLPPVIQFPILYHHEPDLANRQGATPDLNKNIDIVLLANLIIHALDFGHSGHDKKQGAPKKVLERLGIKETDFPIVVENVRQSLTSAESFLRLLTE
ncbi:MAG: HDOD domain-containing protein [Bdellovibrionales bacterium]